MSSLSQGWTPGLGIEATVLSSVHPFGLSPVVVNVLTVRVADVETRGPGEVPKEKGLEGQRGQGLALGSPIYYGVTLDKCLYLSFVKMGGHTYMT